MKVLFAVVLLFALSAVALARGPPQSPTVCDRESAAFQTRHSMQIGTEQANRETGALWKQDVAVIAQVPIDTENTLAWVQVIDFTFWQDNYWAADVCAWNETQAWWRQDVATGEYVLAMQRTLVAPTAPFARTDFSTAPPTVEESESSYTATWVNGAYIEESAIVINTNTYEYALGPKVVSAGWYEQSGRLSYVNTLFNYVDHYYRTYTLNTVLEAVPGDQTTQYKVLADITSTVNAPPEIITAAFQWFYQVVDDPNFQRTLNPNTGIEEYIFVPSQHAPAAAKRMDAAKPAVNFHDHQAVQTAIQAFADKE